MVTRVLAHGGDTPLPALDGLRWLTSRFVDPGVLIPLVPAGEPAERLEWHRRVAHISGLTRTSPRDTV